MWSEVCEKYGDNAHSGNISKKKQHKYKPKHAKSWVETGFFARLGRWFLNLFDQYIPKEAL